MKHELPENGLRSEFGDFQNFLIFWCFLTAFKHSMRKRKRILRHETYAKRRVNVCSLDLWKLELKRIVKFFTVPAQSCQNDTFLESRDFGANPWVPAN